MVCTSHILMSLFMARHFQVTLTYIGGAKASSYIPISFPELAIDLVSRDHACRAKGSRSLGTRLPKSLFSLSCAKEEDNIKEKCLKS